MSEKLVIDEHDLKTSSLEKTAILSINSVLESNFFGTQTAAILENLPICIKVLDLDFNLQFMSSAGIKSLHIEDITSFYNKPYPFSFYPKSFRDRMIKNLNEVVKNHKIVKQEASVVDLKGKELWYHSTIMPVENETGQIDNILVVSIESTANRQANIELFKLRKLLENIGLKFLVDRLQFLVEHYDQNLNANFITKVSKTILANMCDNSFDVNALAEHLFMSRSTLQRKLTKESGVSAALFIRQMRLAMAHELIKNNTHKTLAETAYSVGFKHPGHFTKLYKKYAIEMKDDNELFLKHQSCDAFDQNVDAHFHSILANGLNVLSLTLAVISRIENNLYKIVAVISESNIFVPGEVFQLQETYCKEVFENGKTLALTQFDDKEGLCKHPLYDKMPLEAYISTPIYKKGKVWGTLNFSANEIKSDTFKDEEISFIENLAMKVSATI